MSSSTQAANSTGNSKSIKLVFLFCSVKKKQVKMNYFFNFLVTDISRF